MCGYEQGGVRRGIVRLRSMKFRCEQCKSLIAVDNPPAGAAVRCRRCGHVAALPQDADDGTVATAEPDDALAELAALESAPMTPAEMAQIDRPSDASKTPVSDKPLSVEVDRDLHRKFVRYGFAAGVLAVVAAWVFGNLVTFLFVAFVAFATLNGYWLGASKAGAAVCGMLVAALLAVPMGKALEGLFGSMFGTTGLTNRLISIAIMAVVLTAAAAVALKIVIGRVFKDRPSWGRYDRYVGSGLGLVEGAMLGLMVIWAVLAVQPMAASSKAATGDQPNTGADQVLAMGDAIRDSNIGRLADAVNPLSEMRLIALLQDALRVLNDPVARSRFVEHPAMKSIGDRPAVKEAMDMFKADPQINAVIDSAGSITREQIRAILDSPTLLKVLDETDIVDVMMPMADDLEKAIKESLGDEPTPPEEAPPRNRPAET